MLSIALDRGDQQPLYQQVKVQIIRQIEGGFIAPGDRLPPTRDLADQLGVARISVVNAYEELKAEGYIEAQVGRGTYVVERASAALDNPASALTGSGRVRGAAMRDLLRLADRPGVINFSTGTPADSFLPVDLIRESMDVVLGRDGAAAIAYEQPEGFLPLREAVAAMVASIGISVPSSEILITGGCQQALDLAVQALLNPGDVLLTPNPTYAGMLDIAQARGVNLAGVPVDAEGMQTAALEDLIIEHRPRLLYIAPTYHNPTGTVMPLHRRRHLLDIAARYHLPILEDGVYEDLVYEGTPPPPLKALDEEGLVLYASSFSKVLLPGMRIGYLIVGGRLYRRLARVKAAADICTPSLNQRAIHYALGRGAIAEHLKDVQAICRHRRAVMLKSLAENLPQMHWVEPAGGLYLWIELPSGGPGAAELYIHAVNMGAAFAMGSMFFVDGRGGHYIRLNMVSHSTDVVEEGIKRLAAAWHSLAADYQAPDPSRSVPVL